MKKGITLIEILIYASLLSLTVSFIIGVLSNFLFFRGIILTREETTRSIVYILEDIEKEIKQSDEILYPLPGSFSSKISLKKEGKDLTYEIKEGKIIKKIEERSYILSPGSLKIASLQFEHLKQREDTPSSIQIKLEVEYNNPLHLREYEFSTFFQTAATQRK